jgi:flagellar basal-body rod protein FlgF
MENVSYIGLSQQLALSQQIEVTANNIANMSTPGYKTQGILFLDYVTKPKDGQPINQSFDFATYRDLSAGSQLPTGNPLDMAISGDGYFAIQTKDGVRYTRDGSFVLNAERQVVNAQGNALLDDGGSPIVIPQEVTNVTVSSDGVVSGETGNIGRVSLVTFANLQMMKKEGDNLYTSGGQAETPVENRRVAQGLVEASNVNPVVEMNRMIELMRLFQATQKMLDNDHDRIRGSIQKLTSVG